MPLVNTGIGVSQKDNLIEAAKEAAQRAKEELGEKKPKLLMFFCLYTYPKEQYKQAQEIVHEVFRDKKIPLVGGTVLGFFAKDKYYFDINLIGRIIGIILGTVGKIIRPLKFKGVAVLALESDFLSIGTGIGLDTDKDPEKAGKDSITQALDNLEYNPSVAYLAMVKKGAKDITRFRPINGILLTPGSGPEHNLLDQQILKGITSIGKRAIRLTGGGLAMGLSVETATFLVGYHFFNGEVYKEAVISIVFGSDLEIGYGVGVGAVPMEPGFFVTKGKNWIIEELNGRPADEVLSEAVEKYIGVKKEVFLKAPAEIVLKGYTFAIPEVTGKFYWPLMITKPIKPKRVETITPIRTGMGFQLARISKESCRKAVADSTQIMIDDIESNDFGLVIFFSCAGRGQILGTKYFKEVEMIKKTLKKKDVPVFGICSASEQAFYKLGPMIGTTLTITMMGISNRLISEVRE